MTNNSYKSFFAALSGGRRLEIIQHLLHNDRQSVNAIADATDIEQSAASHSLAKLLACEFVHLEVSGKQRLYSLNTATIIPLFGLIDQHIATFCTHNCNSCSADRSCHSKRPQPSDLAGRSSNINKEAYHVSM